MLLAAAVVASGLVVPALTATPAAAATSTLAGTTVLPTAQINGVVWNQVTVGDWVYAGGEFTKARPAGAAAGTKEVTRSNIMSYRLSTGVMGGFAPAFNDEVKNMAVSPDKKTLYVVGTFTKVGTVTRNRIAAFDLATGKLTSFAPNLNTSAYSVVATSKGVFVGGAFTTANGNVRYRGAAFSTSGALLKWAPNVQGGDVRDMVATKDGTGLILGGSFTSVDGSSKGFGLALVGNDAGTKLYPMPVNDIIRNGASVKSGIYDLASDGNGFYGSGWGNSPTLEGSFRADWSGKLIWVEDCHGDTYSIWPTAEYLYTASHAHYCANTGSFAETNPQGNQRGMAFTLNARGKLSTDPTYYKDWGGTARPTVQPFLPDIDAGTYTGQKQGAWSVTGSGNYVLYAGEFTTVNGKAQQGLVRFANRLTTKSTDGPLVSSSYSPSVKTYSGGVARVRWPSVSDRDNNTVSYQLIRDGNNSAPLVNTSGPAYYWLQPSMGYLDTGLVSGQTYVYQVRVADPDGNVRWSKKFSYTYQPTQTPVTGYPTAVLKDNPDLYWVGADNGSGLAKVADIAAGQVPQVGDRTGSTTNTITADDGVLGGATKSFGFSGSQMISTPTTKLAPNTFSVEAWFKTPAAGSSGAAEGGAIVSSSSKVLADSPAYPSTNPQYASRADRTVYVGASGKLNFGVWARGPHVITSAKSYDDGQWHHVVGTMDYSGMKLFVDGAQVAAATDTFVGANVTGYWRIGGDKLDHSTASDPSGKQWPDLPTGGGYFSGDIDQVGIYTRALNATQVSTHYQAR